MDSPRPNDVDSSPMDDMHSPRTSDIESSLKPRYGWLSKPSRTRQPAPKLPCPHCKDHPDGFRGEHELQRHLNRAHAKFRKVWICVDSSENKKFLANCKACRTQKRYGAFYNAAAHLRRAHFNPRKKGRRSDRERRPKGGGHWPPMNELKQHWMREIEEIVIDDVLGSSQIDDETETMDNEVHSGVFHMSYVPVEQFELVGKGFEDHLQSQHSNIGVQSQLPHENSAGDFELYDVRDSVFQATPSVETYQEPAPNMETFMQPRFERISPGYIKYECQRSGCGRTFTRLADLQDHETDIHLPQDRLRKSAYKCTRTPCTKAFATKADLQRHQQCVHKIIMETHSQAKQQKFVCHHVNANSNTTCGKAFARKADLQRHELCTHDRDKVVRLECTYRMCGRKGKNGFLRQDHSTEHLRHFHYKNIPKRRSNASFEEY